MECEKTMKTSTVNPPDLTLSIALGEKTPEEFSEWMDNTAKVVEDSGRTVPSVWPTKDAPDDEDGEVDDE